MYLSYMRLKKKEKALTITPLPLASDIGTSGSLQSGSSLEASKARLGWAWVNLE